MHKISLLSTVVILNTVIASSVFATSKLNNTDADQRFVYIGAEYGLSEPVKRKFMHENSKTAISLKRSSMYSGKIGYSFYPQMALELSATTQPKYKLGYLLGETNETKKIPGKTKVASEVYMLNLVYDLTEYKGFTPFVIIGGGLARVKIKEATSKAILNDATKNAISAGYGPQAAQVIAKTEDQDVFRVKKHTQDCKAWQVGVGVSKDIADNLSIDLAGRLQVVHDIKINYEQFNDKTSQFEKRPAIKKTIGVWEFGVGFTYKLPI